MIRAVGCFEGTTIMAATRYLFAALATAFAMPAGAGILVLGSTDARICYLAADSSIRPTARDLDTCDNAVADPGLSQHDLVASYVNRGIVRLRRGGVEQSIGDFDTALRLDPRQPEASLNKAAALMRLNNAREALPLFTVALENHTERPALAHFGRAIANEALGNVREAYADYQMASALDPGWSEPRSELRRFRVVPH